MTIVLCS